MQLTTVFYVLTFSSYAISAPMAVAPARSVHLADAKISILRQEPGSRWPAKTTARMSIKTPEKKKKKSKDQRSRLGSSQVLISLDGVTPLTKEPPRKTSPSSYLGSLAHRLTNKSPFADSSIVREETRASTEDWEPEATIVEWETKASRESYIWIPCFSHGKALHYHRVRVYADMLVVSLVLTLVAVLLIIELWKPVITRLRYFRSGHGPIYLDANEDSTRGDLERQPRVSGTPLAPAAVAENKQETDNEESNTNMCPS